MSPLITFLFSAFYFVLLLLIREVVKAISGCTKSINSMLIINENPSRNLSKKLVFCLLNLTCV